MFLLLVLFSMFARDREYAIVDLDANLVLLSLRDVRTDDEPVTAPKGLELWKQTGTIPLIRIASRLNGTLPLARGSRESALGCILFRMLVVWARGLLPSRAAPWII
jgi:hypothetical protein